MRVNSDESISLGEQAHRHYGSWSKVRAASKSGILAGADGTPKPVKTKSKDQKTARAK